MPFGAGAPNDKLGAADVVAGTELERSGGGVRLMLNRVNF
jgi:hypothetical protein